MKYTFTWQWYEFLDRHIAWAHYNSFLKAGSYVTKQNKKNTTINGFQELGQIDPPNFLRKNCEMMEAGDKISFWKKKKKKLQPHKIERVQILCLLVEVCHTIRSITIAIVIWNCPTWTEDQNSKKSIVTTNWCIKLLFCRPKTRERDQSKKNRNKKKKDHRRRARVQGTLLELSIAYHKRVHLFILQWSTHKGILLKIIAYPTFIEQKFD